jgi:hypothetical protein
MAAAGGGLVLGAKVRGCRGHAVRRCGATNAAGLGKRERCKEEESTVDECGRAINGRIKKEKGGGRQWLGWCADGVRAARGRLSGPAVNKFCTCVTYSGRLHPGRCACTGSCGSPSGPARSLCHTSRHMTSRARRCASCRRAAAERRPARRRIHGFHALSRAASLRSQACVLPFTPATRQPAGVAPLWECRISDLQPSSEYELV